MDWVLGDVLKIHATTGIEPILPPPPGVPPLGFNTTPGAGPGCAPGMPGVTSSPVIVAPPVAAPSVEPDLPAPRPVPPAPGRMPPAEPGSSPTPTGPLGAAGRQTITPVAATSPRPGGG